MLQSENANLLCVRWRQVWYQESTDDLSPSSSSKRYLPYSLTTSSISPRLALQKRQEKKRRLAVLRIPQTPHTISLSWMELRMSASLGSAWSYGATKMLFYLKPTDLIRAASMSVGEPLELP
jgi:hypothetical protein